MTLDEFDVRVRVPGDPAAAHTGAATSSERLAATGHRRHGDVTRRLRPRRHQPRSRRALRARVAARPADFAGLPGRRRTSRSSSGARAASTMKAAERRRRAGADAVILFNQGEHPDRCGPGIVRPASHPTLGTFVASIPVVGTTFRGGRIARAGWIDGPVVFVRNETRTDVNVIAELPGDEHRQRRDGRRAPRLRDARTGDQRQRLRLGRAARDGADARQGEAGEHAPVRLVGRRGVGSGRLDGVRERTLDRPTATGSRCT